MKMDPSAWGYNWITLFLGYINTGNWPFKLGEGGGPESEKYILNPVGLGPKNEGTGETSGTSSNPQLTVVKI
jgi:hypothetical protein